MITRLNRITGIILFGCCIVQYIFAQDQRCYAGEQYPYIYFSSKTAYELILPNKFQNIPDCTPVSVWMLSRHGTRYPDKEDIDELRQLTSIRDLILRNQEINLCYEDIQNLRHWTFNLTDNLDNELTWQGREDLRLHGSRLKSKFPTVFYQPYTPENYEFRTTTRKRTIDSAKSMAEGLFGYGVPLILPTPTENDTLLYNTEFCKTWEDHQLDPSIQEEYKLANQEPFVKNMISQISRRLGFQNELDLNDIKKMYDMCRYEKAWYIRSRPAFCAVFSHDDFKVMEFLEDLKYYYKYGYPNKLSADVSCPLIKDLITKFGKIAENRTDGVPIASLYFAHTDVILPFVTALGIKKDEQPLTHDSFETMLKREWRTSLIDPFAANLVAVLYKCNGGTQNKAMFYLNEQIVPYPGCDVGLCDWEKLKEKFNPLVESGSCNYKFCSTPSSAHRPTSSPTNAIILLLGIISSSVFLIHRYE